MTQETIARLRISLNDIEPEIWRSVEIPVTASLKMLHDVIQAAMGWQDYHLWHFEAGDRRYGVPNPEWPDRNLTNARNVKLGSLIDLGVRQLTYTYDMGDDWRHTVVVDAVGPAEPDIKYPRFVAGERGCPPEDVGGFPGFELFLDAMSDPAHGEHQQLRQWYGGPFDPDDIDELAIKRAVAAIAIRRHVGKAAYEKSRVRH
ncbi:plasmid pRiA4b ORF-3 family protein [Sphingomonas faeni]|uniref:plasmid pRiA4b ORF-3 family protein n=1 Tax=Sphingomonas faeni TaxID=185950 RepID=UPI00334C7B1E